MRLTPLPRSWPSSATTQGLLLHLFIFRLVLLLFFPLLLLFFLLLLLLLLA